MPTCLLHCIAPLPLPDCFPADPTTLTVTPSHPSTSCVAPGRPSKQPCSVEKGEAAPPAAQLCEFAVKCLSRADVYVTSLKTLSFLLFSREVVPGSPSRGDFSLRAGLATHGLFCQNKINSESLRLINHFLACCHNFIQRVFVFIFAFFSHNNDTCLGVGKVQLPPPFQRYGTNSFHSASHQETAETDYHTP